MKHLALLACLAILLLAALSPAQAQVPVACGCYCGTTISPPCSEQACKNACGWRGGGDNRGGSRGGRTQLWYCRALASNGAAGWAWSGNLNWARQRALTECRQRGRRCAIEACRINDPSLARLPRGTRSSTRRHGRTTDRNGWCELCTRKLRNDVNAGWASALIRSYVGQAIAGYENCKRRARAGGTCVAGDRLVYRLRACSHWTFSAYRACISKSLR